MVIFAVFSIKQEKCKIHIRDPHTHAHTKKTLSDHLRLPQINIMLDSGGAGWNITKMLPLLKQTVNKTQNSYDTWTPIVFNGPLTPHTDNMILKLECDASEITSLV